jgi:RNA polymerase sigma factor (sigma-70 family)
MDRHQMPDCLQKLRSAKSREAWAQFLQDYSGLILQVISLSERDPDQISDCFVFACEQLSRNNFHRLCQFEPTGAATFPTWLRAVVRHLFIDWRRKEFGRYRISQSIAHLSGFDQAVFQLLYEQHASREESLVLLARNYPETTADRLRKSVEQIQQALTPRQRWLLSSRHRTPTAAAAFLGQDNVSLLEQIPDSLPDPESRAAQDEELDGISKALSALDPRDRLLIRLRYEQGLTLEQVARLMKLPNAQSADRSIQKVLQQLRNGMTE